MKITVTTTAKNGHLIIYIINSNDAEILTVKDADTKNCMLVPGKTYSFEWHVWSAQASEYTIEAFVDPASPGFPPLKFTKTYEEAAEHVGVFSFTI